MGKSESRYNVWKMKRDLRRMAAQRAPVGVHQKSRPPHGGRESNTRRWGQVGPTPSTHRPDQAPLRGTQAGKERLEEEARARNERRLAELAALKAEQDRKQQERQAASVVHYEQRQKETEKVIDEAARRARRSQSEINRRRKSPVQRERHNRQQRESYARVSASMPLPERLAKAERGNAATRDWRARMTPEERAVLNTRSNAARKNETPEQRAERNRVRRLKRQAKQGK